MSYIAGHPGTDRTTELIKSKFYWPLIDDEIKHFVTQVCPCVKRKKPHIMKEAAIQSISTSEPLEIISMDFLRLDKSSGGYQYLFVVTDLFTKFTQVYDTRNKERKTAQKDFTMTSSSSLVYLEKYCMIKGRSLITISSNILHNSVTSKEFELHHTTLRPMTKQRG